MEGCIQDIDENRLSALHEVVDEQIEEIHQRIDAQGDKMAALDELSKHNQGRAAQLGLVVSSCMASIHTLTDRLNQLDMMRDEVRELGGVGAALMSAVRPVGLGQASAASSGVSEEYNKTPKADKSGSQRSQGHRVDQTLTELQLSDCPNSCSESIQGWSDELTGPATMPFGLSRPHPGQVYAFYRRSGPRSYERGAQREVTVIPTAEVRVVQRDVVSACEILKLRAQEDPLVGLRALLRAPHGAPCA